MILPQHLAIIMDGNGRWAQQRGKPRTYGHVKGTRVAKQIITECSRRGIKNLTLYAFSSENWFRPQMEISFLMTILRRYLRRETQNLIKENIRFSVIGEWERLPTDVISSIRSAMEATQKCTGLHLVFALSYGSRQEMTNTFKNLARRIEAGTLKADEIDEALIQSSLSTYPTPDPDLIIRTSGEQRLSNFLLWQAAYAEFYFDDTLWPDFTKAELDKALHSYGLRQRRFGKVESSHEKLHH